MWMLNDLPKNMRKDLNAQLGLIWLLLSEKQCFPCLTFTEAEQRAICDELVANSCQDGAADFNFTYEALLKYEARKVKTAEDAGNDDDNEHLAQAEKASSSSPTTHSDET